MSSTFPSPTTLQAHNGVLQSLPFVIFTLFAGPLSDTYGRKILMILPLIGFFILNLVFLVNVVWFAELQVGPLTTLPS